MSVDLLLKIVVGLILFLLVTLIVLLIILKVRTQEQRELKKLYSMVPRKGANGFNLRYIGVRLYPMIDNVPLLRNLLRFVRFRVESLHIGDERDVRSKSALYTLYAVGIFMLFALASIVVVDGVYSKLGVLFAGAYVVYVLFDTFILRLQKSMLYAQRELLQSVKHAYHQTKMVSESLLIASETAKPEAAAHAREIAEILTSLDPEAELIKYYDVAPNSFMKKLAGITYNVTVYGEPKEGPSVLIRGIENISEDIHMEIMRRENLDYLTSGVMFMAVTPIFGLEPLRNWAEENFPGISGFFTSKMGLYSMFLIYLSILVSFVVLILIKSMGTIEQKQRTEGRIASLLLKFRRVRILIERFAPTNGKSVRSVKILRRVVPLLTSANSSLSPKQYFVNKWLTAIISFALVLGIQVQAHKVERLSMLDLKAFTEQIVTDSDFYELRKRRFESSVLTEYSHADFSEEELRGLLRMAIEDSRVVSLSEVEAYIDGLLSKINKYEKETLRWYDLIIALGVSSLFYYLQDLLLHLRAFVRRGDMQIEVDGMIGLLTVLSKVERIMVYEILEWLHRYSVIFEPYLTKALSNYESGPEEVLNELKSEVQFLPFQRIVDRLLSCISSISVKDAFSDLDSDRVFLVDQRELQNKRSIENKSQLAMFFGWVPVITLVSLYLLFPFGYMLAVELSQVQDVISNLGG